MGKAERNPRKTYEWYQSTEYTFPEWKVTGKMFTGRMHIKTGEAETQQLPPRYFNTKSKAQHYLENFVASGCLWKKNPEVGKWKVDGRRVNPRSQYIIKHFKNIQWGQGANLGYSIEE